MNDPRMSDLLLPPINATIIQRVAEMFDEFTGLFGGWFNWDSSEVGWSGVRPQAGRRFARIRNYKQGDFVLLYSNMLRAARTLCGEAIGKSDTLGIIRDARKPMLHTLDRKEAANALVCCSHACKIVASGMLDNRDKYSWSLMVSDKEYEHIQDAIETAWKVLRILKFDPPVLRCSPDDVFVVINDGFSIVGREGYTAGIGLRTVTIQEWQEQQDRLRKAIFGEPAPAVVPEAESAPASLPPAREAQPTE